MSEQAFLTRKKAAAWLTARGIGMSVPTLARYAMTGIGPRFIRQTPTPSGRIFYPVTSLEAWIAEIEKRPAR